MHRNDFAIAFVVLFSVLIFTALLKKVLRCLYHRPRAQPCTPRTPDVEQEYPQIPPEQLDTTRMIERRIDGSERLAYYGTCPEEGETKNGQSGEPPEYSQNPVPYSDHVEGPPNSPTAYGNHTLQPHRLGPTNASLSSVDELECLPGALYSLHPATLVSEALQEPNGPAFLRWGNRRMAPWEYSAFGEDHMFRAEFEEKILEPSG